MATDLARPAAGSISAARGQRALPALMVALVVAFFARQFALRLYDADLGGRLAVGRLFCELGEMPKTDPFAYTPTLPLWVDHE